MNLLALPKLLRQICLPSALPAATLQMANLWVGGELMKNGLHFDNYDNLLHQVRGKKRAILFPPEDTPHLYYGAASIHRHGFELPGGVGNQTTFEKVRHNVAMVNVFADDVGTTHPLVRKASPTRTPTLTRTLLLTLALGLALALALTLPRSRRPLPRSASWTRATHSSCPAAGTMP